MGNGSGPRQITWIGSSYRDLCALPAEVRSHLGYALFVAQMGGKHRDAKPLQGFGGAGVVEIVSDRRGDTFRAVYTVRFVETVYVLHVFQKKSKSGKATPKSDLDLVARRLKEAELLARGELG